MGNLHGVVYGRAADLPSLPVLNLPGVPSLPSSLGYTGDTGVMFTGQAKFTQFTGFHRTDGGHK